MRCTATTSRATPGRNRTMTGHEVCQPHSGGQVGRRTKLTDELEREILDAIKAGSYLNAAARRAGVSEKTVYAWLRVGRSEDPRPGLARFAAEFERAEAEAEVSVVATVRRAIGKGDGRLGLDFLARRHPDRWARNRPGAAEEPRDAHEEQPLDLSRLSDEDYQQLKELQRRASDS